ncbi:MAG TPA: hypothetical protein VF469_04905, partial [Kofleriaceae bacterium]
MPSNHGLYLPLATIALGLLTAPVAGCGAVTDDTASPAPAVAPDADGRPLAEVAPHWDALIARSGGVPAVRWSDRGTAMSLYGTLSGPRGAAPADAARGFLADHAGLFQLTGDPAELDEQGSVESPLGTHVTFAQRSGGVPVFGAEVKVHFDRAGRIVAVNNTSVPGLALDTRPRISAQRALDAALATVTADRTDADAPEPPELVIHTDAGAPALAYRVVVP